jgi:hypothetical protein
MKTCFCCKKKKDESNFYKHKQSKDGLSSYCASCAKIKKRAEYLKNRDKYDQRAKVYTSKNRDKVNAISRKRNSRDKIKLKARSAIGHMVRKAKKIQRPFFCEHCGHACKAQAHHPDYNLPLKVIWLCSECHYRLHSRS